MLLNSLFDLSIYTHSDTWISLITLTLLEIVLGIDNIIFVSITASQLPKENQAKARSIGLVLALVLRIALLFVISWVMHLDKVDVFTIPMIDKTVTVKGLILILGGLFLIGKSVSEIHGKLEGLEESKKGGKANGLLGAVLMICAINLVFSFDSILTAIGLVDPSKISVMMISIILSIIVMIVFSNSVSRFISKHPTIEILALSFLIMIGFMLFIEGLNYHVDKGYVYFAMFFALGVEVVNMRFRKKAKPINLRDRKDDFEKMNEKH